VYKKRLASFFKTGCLTVVDASGKSRTFGVAGTSPNVWVQITGAPTMWKLALRPDLYLGEAYADGSLKILDGSLWDLLDLLGRNLVIGESRRDSLPLRAAKAAIRYLQQNNRRKTAKANVHHHYDLSFDLYRSFLDDDLQYSCAYFGDPSFSLEDAQAAKKAHIIAKLRLKAGQKILDIGCGWGGLALSIARHADVRVVGITLSGEQLEVARDRARAEGLADRVSFELMDYRDVAGPFDRIVSVGMFEHVGAPNYPKFFLKVKSLLVEDGIALVHSIGRAHGPDVTSAWIRKYIFPGGYIPAISQVVPAVERSGLWLTDLEILRLHYAETLRHWRSRFIKTCMHMPERFDDRFARIWEFYLAISEMSFRYGGMMVFQMQLSRTVDALPISRDYMFEEEHKWLRPIAAE
jgi:cyclopropane-fatty-acyl-phospholipid synthase